MFTIEIVENPFVSDIAFSLCSHGVSRARAHRETGDIHWEPDEATIIEKRLVLREY